MEKESRAEILRKKLRNIKNNKKVQELNILTNESKSINSIENNLNNDSQTNHLINSYKIDNNKINTDNVKRNYFY